MKDSFGLYERKDTSLAGCYEIQPVVRGDARGSFVKTFHKAAFEELALATDYIEQYYSVSVRGVVRGLHFQTPPGEHEKLVYCGEGTVMDVALDLRKTSKTYGCFYICTLEAEKGNMVYLPRGMAHGFCTLSDRAVMMYMVTSMYDPTHDTGILWNSVGIPWKIEHPVLSERDKNFVKFEDFDSPF